jgi:dTDP-glucose pyrophosphorylase
MAGEGSRFRNVGYVNPKPLIEIHGAPMIKVVIDNIRPKTNHRFVFLVRTEHLQAFDLAQKLKTWAGEQTVVIPVERLTEGAACTVLLAKDVIDSSNPLMIANSDQWVDISIDSYLNTISQSDLDGLIMTMKADHPKWSYVGFDAGGWVNQVVEKVVISDEATVGIYNFRNGSDFVSGAEKMIQLNLRSQGEFYVAPVYNLLIEQGKKIGVFNIGTDTEGMYGLGTPPDLERFLSLPVSYRATAE